MLELAVFVPRLKQVITWTEQLVQQFVYPSDRQNYGAVLRQINPIIGGHPLYTSDRGYTTWTIDDYNLDSFEQALQMAINQRDIETSVPVCNFVDFQKLGRILYFETGVTTHDGTALVESNCFVDESDVPPIDTWFFLDRNTQNPALSKDNIFCWIPKQFVPIMQEAINAEMMNSYHWLDEAGPRTHQQIVAAMSAQP